MPVVSVVIPTHNRIETLRRTIGGYLRHASRSPFELLVVDDGSSDGTWEYLSAEARCDSRLRPVRQEHAGPARARNLAISRAAGSLLLLAGDDVRPADGLVDGHLAAHEGASPRLVVLGRTEWDPERPITPVMRHVTGFGGQQFRYAYLKDGQRLGFRYFYSSNLSLRRERLASIPDPFDPSFGGAAFEDTDLGYRLMGTSAAILYRSGLLAHHDHPYRLASFAERQRRVGRSAEVLVRKHPGIAPLFGLRAIDAANEAAQRAASRAAAVGEREVAEAETLLLAALAPLEDEAGRDLDRACLALFWYAYARGVVEWRVAVDRRAAASVELWLRALRCPLRSLASSPAGAADLRTRLLQLSSAFAHGRTAFRAALECLHWRLDLRLREIRYLACRGGRGV
jgi:GT2 family glycosyltransferase